MYRMAALRAGSSTVSKLRDIVLVVEDTREGRIMGWCVRDVDVICGVTLKLVSFACGVMGVE